MEAKLMRYAEALPQPQRGFPAVEATIRNLAKPKKAPRRVFRAAVALVLLLCLTTTVYAYGKVKYGLWSGLHSSAYADVQILNWKYDYRFPKELWGLPFSDMGIYYGAPQGSSHLEALIAPSYALNNVDYGEYMGTIQEDGTTLWTDKRIAISFGTTEKEVWKYHFNVAEDGSCNYEGVQPGSQSSLEYEGYTLYLYTVSYPSVRWEDADKNLVIDITLYGSEYDGEVVDIAKTLIDLNQAK